MSATSHRRSTADVVNQLVTVVSAIQWKPDPAGALVPAFDKVVLFDSDQLVEAFRYLVVVEEKVCVVVPLDEKFETVFQQRKLTVKRELPVALLISDRYLGDRKAAVWGDRDPTPPNVATAPGAMGLLELTLPAVTGKLLDAAAPATAVIAEPVSATVMTVKDTEKDLPGRACVALELRCRGGYLESTDMPAGAVM